MKAKLGLLLMWPVPIVLGLLAIWVCNGVVYRAFGGGFRGFLCVLVGIFILPFTIIAAPLYAGFKWGTWVPLIVTYTLGLAAMVLMNLGRFLLFSSFADEQRKGGAGE